MGIRESINKQPLVGIIVTVAVVAVGAIMAWRNVTGPRLDGSFQGYYSDDDGKTYFADAFPKDVPFNHNGRQAYRARVFRCGAQPSVAWLESFPPDVDAAFNSQTDAQARFVSFQSVSDRVLVKRPGDANWVAPASHVAAQPATRLSARSSAKEYQDIITPPCSGTTAELLPGSK